MNPHPRCTVQCLLSSAGRQIATSSGAVSHPPCPPPSHAVLLEEESESFSLHLAEDAPGGAGGLLLHVADPTGPILLLFVQWKLPSSTAQAPELLPNPVLSWLCWCHAAEPSHSYGRLRLELCKQHRWKKRNCEEPQKRAERRQHEN